MSALKEKVEKEIRESSMPKNDTVRKIVKREKSIKKDKVVSMKVNSDMWGRFKTITEKYGATANGILNQLVSDYVMREEKKLKDLEVI